MKTIFFDLYTPNDTHTYNIRDIQSNDGAQTGVVLPDGAYGIFVAFGEFTESIIGNIRILDANGYEYRTNIQGTDMDESTQGPGDLEEFATFNFNTEGGVTLSDIVLIAIEDDDSKQEALLANVLDIWVNVGVDIYDINENPFSCRPVIFSCITQDSALYESLLEEVPNECDDCGASVADLEFGINDAIPHSKGGELLCPGNNISEGFVRLEHIDKGSGEQFSTQDEAVSYIGYNNGNGRGSMDAFWVQNGAPIEEP